MCLSSLLMYVQSNVASSFLSSTWTEQSSILFCTVVCFPDQWIRRKTRGGSHYRKLKRIQGLCRGTRTFTVKKQFRGNRLMFYNLWVFMWRVFKVSILESFTFACVFKSSMSREKFCWPKGFIFFFLIFHKMNFFYIPFIIKTKILRFQL